MKKSLFFAALFAVAAFLPTVSLHAQRFEWVKGYNSPMEINHIQGTVTDSLGNLYILGQFTNDAQWEGDSLLPMTPPIANLNDLNTIIAKISPNGNMIWKKVLHSNNYKDNRPQDIRKVGDSAFACMIQMSAPSYYNNTYYLDRLISGMSDYPVRVRYLMDKPTCNAFIVFDFNGNVKEQHFLHLSYVDANGNDILNYNMSSTDPEPWYCSDFLRDASFDIDGDGNIYVSRVAEDHIIRTSNGIQTHNYSTQAGTIRGVKFWVDTNVVGQYTISGDGPMSWYPQLLKFAPHFDTLQDCRYIIQGQSDSLLYGYLNKSIGSTTRVDSNGNVYYVCVAAPSCIYQNGSPVVGLHSNTLYIDTTNGLYVSHTNRNSMVSFLIKFNSKLNSEWLISLDDSIINNSTGATWTCFRDLFFDYDNNMMLLSMYSDRGVDSSNLVSIPMYRGVPINIKSEAVVLAFKMDNDLPILNSVCAVPSVRSSRIESPSRGNLWCSNNRIFMQSYYRGGIRLPENNIQLNNINDNSLGLVIFDYSGKAIGGIHYATVSTSSTSLPGSIALQDSILYLTNLLSKATATFGDIDVSMPREYVCVAKYVDTSFMTPHVITGDTGNVSIVMSGDDDAFVVYPNPFRHRVTVRYDGGEELTAAYVTSLEGRSEPVKLQREGAGRYTIDLTARPQSTCLLTLVTASGRMHTLRLLKQSDMFGDQ